jgi:hypothetical protein
MHARNGELFELCPDSYHQKASVLICLAKRATPRSESGTGQSARRYGRHTLGRVAFGTAPD